jgi:Predicted lipoprotein of unknown function (DUF2380)
LSELEPHHTLPGKFLRRFKGAGIDIDDYILYLPRGPHRLRPDGLHTGSNHWNAQWQRFFDERSNPTPDQILEHLNDMLKTVPR